MNSRVLSAVTLLLLLLNATGLTFAVPNENARRAQTDPLLRLLPDSDAVALIDSRRFFDTALPSILATKPAMLADINAKLDEIQQKTSIDLRKFDRLAVGLKLNKTADNSFDCDPVVLARGTYNSGALVGIAKLASKGTYREEKLGEHTLYIFSVKDVAAKNAASTASGITGTIDSTIDKLTGEIAITGLDANTLAIGTVARVRETIEGQSRVASDVLGVMSPYDRAIVSFGARTPEGMARFLPMDNDELGKTLGAIRFLAGGLDMNAGAANLQVLARAASADDAQGVFDTAQGAQQLGMALLGSSKNANNRVLARLVQNAKLARSGNDVTVSLSIPQSDINALMAMLK
ncbi:MAG TPA: hypothetical protein VGJ02_00255 [Pyrinomonadaceae bacterium]